MGCVTNSTYNAASTENRWCHTFDLVIRAAVARMGMANLGVRGVLQLCAEQSHGHATLEST